MFSPDQIPTLAVHTWIAAVRSCPVTRAHAAEMQRRTRSTAEPRTTQAVSLMPIARAGHAALLFAR